MRLTKLNTYDIQQDSISGNINSPQIASYRHLLSDDEWAARLAVWEDSLSKVLTMSSYVKLALHFGLWISILDPQQAEAFQRPELKEALINLPFFNSNAGLLTFGDLLLIYGTGSFAHEAISEWVERSINYIKTDRFKFIDILHLAAYVELVSPGQNLIDQFSSETLENIFAISRVQSATYCQHLFYLYVLSPSIAAKFELPKAENVLDGLREENPSEDTADYLSALGALQLINNPGKFVVNANGWGLELPKANGPELSPTINY